jgi:hypothetical protein
MNVQANANSVFINDLCANNGNESVQLDRILPVIHLGVETGAITNEKIREVNEIFYMKMRGIGITTTLFKTGEIELENITVLPLCAGEFNDVLFSFKDSQGVVWQPDNTDVWSSGYYFSDYVNDKGVALSKQPRMVRDNDIVNKVHFEQTTQQLTVSEVVFGHLDNSVFAGNDVFNVFETAASYSGIASSTVTHSKKIQNPCGNPAKSTEEKNANTKRELEILYSNSNRRAGQYIEIERYDGNERKIFTLQNGSLMQVENPAGDTDIENGNFDKSKYGDTYIRYTYKDGNVQIQAFGFQKDMQIAEGKEDTRAHLPEISRHIKAQTNKYLKENNVKDHSNISKAAEQTETFADGDKISVGGNNSTFIKIISEGIGITTTFFKTGEIEEQVYTTGSQSTIHAPGIVTGSVEVVAQKVTDLTSLATLAYDVAVDKETRSRIYNQFVEIKNEIGDDPKAFLPILIDVIVTVTTNKTPEQIQEIFNEKTDAGQRTHYATSATGNAIMTVMAGAAMVKDLPEIAEKLGENIKKVKKVYTTTINWRNLTIEARPFGKGYFGKRVPQPDPRVDAFELKINPDNESFYLWNSNEERFVQFENISENMLQDGKCVLNPDNSIYRVYDKPEFLRKNILDEAKIQIETAQLNDLKVEWLVSDEIAVEQLQRFFKENNLDIIVKYLAE